MYDKKIHITVREIRELLRKKFVPSVDGAQRYQLRDTSGGDCYGYSFALEPTTYKTKHAYHENGIEKFVYDPVWVFPPTEQSDESLKSFSVYDPTSKNVMGNMGCIRVVFLRGKIEEVLK